jgi:hypothetical protein
VRISGEVVDWAARPVEVEVYERCSRNKLGLFKSCPGKLVGRARIAEPGNFLVAAKTRSAKLYVIAFRGLAPGQEEQCVVHELSSSSATDAITLELEQGHCSVARPKPVTASARSPVTGY